MIYSHIKNGKYSHIKGEISLIVWIFLASYMSVIVRILDNFFDTFSQIFLRTFFALILSSIIYHFFMGKINFSKLNKKDLSIMFLRSVIIFLAIVTYVLAVNNTTLANVGFVGALPTTAIIGIIFLKEKLTKKKLYYLSISVIGTSLILIKNLESFSIGLGETYAVLSAFLFSSGFLIRKKISSSLGDKEVSILGTLFICFFAFLTSIIFENKIDILFSNITNESLFYLILASFVFIGISFFSVYGFKRVSAITSSSIEFLEAVFSLILGYIIFSEIPNIGDFIGGMMIVIGAYLMMRENYTKKSN